MSIKFWPQKFRPLKFGTGLYTFICFLAVILNLVICWSCWHILQGQVKTLVYWLLWTRSVILVRLSLQIRVCNELYLKLSIRFLSYLIKKTFLVPLTELVPAVEKCWFSPSLGLPLNYYSFKTCQLHRVFLSSIAD